ncbi:MAG: SulP family inorganic anion transporter [Chitinophagales bacterium]|nr:SulP family inorganic anion transporter [Chitinophagales bacterium]
MFSKLKLRYYSGIFLKHDLPAGLTVFLVALPLCLGIALASGAPLYAGILSGIIGGIVVTALSGSSLSVSGPAAGLTTVVAAVLLHYQNYPSFLAVVVMAGAFQLLLGILRLGNIAGYFPSSVIKGMLAAIGMLLISKQLPVALGYKQPDFWSKEFINLISDTHLFTNVSEFYASLSAGALIITSFSLLAYTLWELPAFNRFRFVPVPLFVVAGAVLLNLVFMRYAPSLALGKNQFVQLSGSLWQSVQFPNFSNILTDLFAWRYAFIIGLLASLESLLSLEAVDKLDPQQRVSPANRELVAQGVGNMLCGLLGALPVTAVIVRSSANIDAGGRTRLAAFTHGVFLFGAVLLIPALLNLIPLCALAAVLVVTGYKLARPRLFVSMYKLKWNQFLPFAITIVVVLLTDLLIGVSIGLLMSVFFIVRNNYVADFDVQEEKHLGITTYTVNLHTNVTFLDKSKLKTLLEEIPDYSRVVINGTKSAHIDYDVLEAISSFCAQAKRKGIEVELRNVTRVSVSEIH